MSQDPNEPRPLALQDDPMWSRHLKHLRERHPRRLNEMLLAGKDQPIEQHPLTKHLLDVTHRAAQSMGNLTLDQKVPRDAAEDRVMNDLVSPPEGGENDDGENPTPPMLQHSIDRHLKPWQEKIEGMKPIYSSDLAQTTP